MTVFVRNSQRVRRISLAWYKRLLTMHIIVSVGWLGAVLAKFVLGVSAVRASASAVAEALYLAMGVLDISFPPLAIGTIVTGVCLSLGTKWGLLDHYWVATKLVLTVGVITTAVQFSDRLIQRASAAPPGPVADNGTLMGIASAPTTLLICLSVAHLLMLAVATVVSVYKPGGKTWLGRRRAVRSPVHHTEKRL